jgi:hypothetical protein
VSGEEGLAAKARAWRVTLAVFAFTAIYFTGFFPPSNNPNELSRIEAIVAFVDHGTFAIDAPLKRFGDHEDKSFYGGHYYSNKAPGLIFSGIAVYRLLRIFVAEPGTATAPAFVLVRLLTVSLVSFFALSRLARRLSRKPFRDGQGIVTLAVALGTPFLFYARSLFSHAWTAALLFLAWDSVLSSEERPERNGGRLALAGLLAGWAMISEYTVALVVLLLGIRVFAGGRFPAALRFCLGALGPLGLLLLYDSLCFGSPWSLSSAHEASPAFAAAADHGLFGIGPPNVRAVLGLLFSPSRGLILFSPFWLWAVPGFIAWWRSEIARRDCAFAAAAAGLSLIILSGYPQWEGGFCLGSRYLVPLTFFPALALPFAVRSRPSRWLFLAAVSFSVAHLFLLTASWPYIPRDMPWPAANMAWWSISRNWAAPNLGHSLGIPPIWSLLLPALATAAALGLIAMRNARMSRGSVLAAVGLGILALCLAVALPREHKGSTWRPWLIQYLRP